MLTAALERLGRVRVRTTPTVTSAGTVDFSQVSYSGTQPTGFIATPDPISGLERITFNENWDETSRQSLLTDLKQRIRDVRQGPDGLVYVLTDEDNTAARALYRTVGGVESNAGLMITYKLAQR